MSMLSLFPKGLLNPTSSIYQLAQSSAFSPEFETFHELAHFLSSHSTEINSKIQKVNKTQAQQEETKVVEILKNAENEENELVQKHKNQLASYLGYIICQPQLYSAELRREAAVFCKTHWAKLVITDAAKVYFIKYLTKDVTAKDLEDKMEEEEKADYKLETKPLARLKSARSTSEVDSAVDELFECIMTTSQYSDFLTHVIEIISEPKAKFLIKSSDVVSFVIMKILKTTRSNNDDEDEAGEVQDESSGTPKPAAPQSIIPENVVASLMSTISSDIDLLHQFLLRAMTVKANEVISAYGIQAMVQHFPKFSEEQQKTLIQHLVRYTVLNAIVSSKHAKYLGGMLTHLMQFIKKKEGSESAREISSINRILMTVTDQDVLAQYLLDFEDVYALRLKYLCDLLNEADSQSKKTSSSSATSRRAKTSFMSETKLRNAICNIVTFTNHAKMLSLSPQNWDKYFSSRFNGELPQEPSSIAKAGVAVTFYGALLSKADFVLSDKLANGVALKEQQEMMQILQKHLSPAMTVMHAVLSSINLLASQLIPRMGEHPTPTITAWWDEVQPYVVEALRRVIPSPENISYMDRLFRGSMPARLSVKNSDEVINCLLESKKIMITLQLYSAITSLLQFRDSTQLMRWYKYGRDMFGAGRISFANTILNMQKQEPKLFTEILPKVVQDASEDIDKPSSGSSTSTSMARMIKRLLEAYPEQMEPILFSGKGGESSSSASPTPAVMLKLLQSTRISEATLADLMAAYMLFLNKLNSTSKSTSGYSVEEQPAFVAKVNEMVQSKSRFIGKVMVHLPKSMIEAIAEVSYANLEKYLKKRSEGKRIDSDNESDEDADWEATSSTAYFIEVISALVVKVPEMMIPRAPQYYTFFIEDTAFNPSDQNHTQQAVLDLTNYMMKTNPSLFKTKFVEFQTQQADIRHVQILSKASTFGRRTSAQVGLKLDDDSDDEDDDDDGEDDDNSEGNVLTSKLKAIKKQASALKRTLLPSLLRNIVGTDLDNSTLTQRTEAALLISKLKALLGNESWNQFVYGSCSASQYLCYSDIVKLCPLFLSFPFPHLKDVTIICSR